MRKLLLLAFTLGFSSSAFTKENKRCLIDIDGWYCFSFNKEKAVYSDKLNISWYKYAKNVEAGTVLIFEDDLSLMVASYCDFDKSIVVMKSSTKNRFHTICKRV